MSVVAFYSSKGAPGATTAAMLCAALWPRPALLADCDPAGGDMGLRLPSPDGTPLDLSRGMLSLLPVARRALEPQALHEHAQVVLGGGEVLAGMASPEQAVAGGPVWATIAGAFARLRDQDVIVDVGRLHSRSPVLPLVANADLAVLLVDRSLAGVYTARARLRSVAPTLRGETGGGPRMALIVRCDDRREAEATAEVIQAEFPDIVYLGQLAHDATGAGIFDGRPVARPERTLLVRSGSTLVDAMTREIGRVQVSRGRPARDPSPGPAVPAQPVDGANEPVAAASGQDGYAAYAPYLAAGVANVDGAAQAVADGAGAPDTETSQRARTRLEERRMSKQASGGLLRRRHADRSKSS